MDKLIIIDYTQIRLVASRWSDDDDNDNDDDGVDGVYYDHNEG